MMKSASHWLCKRILAFIMHVQHKLLLSGARWNKHTDITDILLEQVCRGPLDTSCPFSFLKREWRAFYRERRPFSVSGSSNECTAARISAQPPPVNSHTSPWPFIWSHWSRAGPFHSPARACLIHAFQSHHVTLGTWLLLSRGLYFSWFSKEKRCTGHTDRW